MIKAIAIDTDHGALGDKRIRINIVDDAEDGCGLPTLGQDKHHRLLLSCIKPFCVDQRHATVQGVDLFRYLLIFLGEMKN